LIAAYFRAREISKSQPSVIQAIPFGGIRSGPHSGPGLPPRLLPPNPRLRLGLRGTWPANPFQTDQTSLLVFQEQKAGGLGLSLAGIRIRSTRYTGEPQERSAGNFSGAAFAVIPAAVPIGAFFAP